jgi:hypothetical protein
MGSACRLLLADVLFGKLSDPEDGAFLRNAGGILADPIALNPRRQHPSLSPLVNIKSNNIKSEEYHLLGYDAV